jgi:hypothetical protein
MNSGSHLPPRQRPAKPLQTRRDSSQLVLNLDFLYLSMAKLSCNRRFGTTLLASPLKSPQKLRLSAVARRVRDKKIVNGAARPFALKEA